MTPDKVEEILAEFTEEMELCDEKVCLQSCEAKRNWFRTTLTQRDQDLMSEVVERCIKEVNYYQATPRVRRDFCEWCDEVLLQGDKCDCKTETVRQELLDLITMDLKSLIKSK